MLQIVSFSPTKKLFKYSTTQNPQNTQNPAFTVGFSFRSNCGLKFTTVALKLLNT